MTRSNKTRSNKIVLAALAVLATAAPLSAMAAPKAKAHAQRTQEQYASGAIATVSAQELKLSDGQTFKLAHGVQTSSYKAGDKVSVRFTTKDGARTADQVMAAKH